MVESVNPQTLNSKLVIHDTGKMECVPGESRRPNPGYIFMIVEMNLKLIEQKKLTIEKNDVYLIDSSGMRWYGNFYTPINYPIDTWAGIRIHASKSELTIISEVVPDFRQSSSRLVAVSKGSNQTVTIKKESAAGLAVDFIKMLFEVPKSKIKDLKLMFRDREVSKF